MGKRSVQLSVMAAGLMLCGAWWLGAAGNAATADEDRMVAPGNLDVEGRRMSCGSAPTLISRTFWDYGGAHRGMIILNPDKLASLPRAVKLFIYAHECGHQVYGASEIKADCYAVQRGRRDGWLQREGIGEICHFFRDDPGDWVHPPGPERCRYMTRCFEGRTPQSPDGGAATLGPAP